MAICISIELYEIVQLRSGDSAALPLTLIVGRWRCRPDVEGGGGPLIRSILEKKDIIFLFVLF